MASSICDLNVKMLFPSLTPTPQNACAEDALMSNLEYLITNTKVETAHKMFRRIIKILYSYFQNQSLEKHTLCENTISKKLIKLITNCMKNIPLLWVLNGNSLVMDEIIESTFRALMKMIRHCKHLLVKFYLTSFKEIVLLITCNTSKIKFSFKRKVIFQIFKDVRVLPGEILKQFVGQEYNMSALTELAYFLITCGDYITQEEIINFLLFLSEACEAKKNIFKNCFSGFPKLVDIIKNIFGKTPDQEFVMKFLSVANSLHRVNEGWKKVIMIPCRAVYADELKLKKPQLDKWFVCLSEETSSILVHYSCQTAVLAKLLFTCDNIQRISCKERENLWKLTIKLKSSMEIDVFPEKKLIDTITTYFNVAPEFREIQKNFFMSHFSSIYSAELSQDIRERDLIDHKTTGTQIAECIPVGNQKCAPSGLPFSTSGNTEDERCNIRAKPISERNNDESADISFNFKVPIRTYSKKSNKKILAKKTPPNELFDKVKNTALSKNTIDVNNNQIGQVPSKESKSKRKLFTQYDDLDALDLNKKICKVSLIKCPTMFEEIYKNGDDPKEDGGIFSDVTKAKSKQRRESLRKLKRISYKEQSEISSDEHSSDVLKSIGTTPVKKPPSQDPKRKPTPPVITVAKTKSISPIITVPTIKPINEETASKLNADVINTSPNTLSPLVMMNKVNHGSNQGRIKKPKRFFSSTPSKSSNSLDNYWKKGFCQLSTSKNDATIDSLSTISKMSTNNPVCVTPNGSLVQAQNQCENVRTSTNRGNKMSEDINSVIQQLALFVENNFTIKEEKHYERIMHNARLDVCKKVEDNIIPCSTISNSLEESVTTIERELAKLSKLPDMMRNFMSKIKEECSQPIQTQDLNNFIKFLDKENYKIAKKSIFSNEMNAFLQNFIDKNTNINGFK